MNKELYVSSTPHETKVALVEDDQLAEVFFERENEYTLAGSIYKGRVTRVLPGMQSAFVDIGLERDAFLYVSDFLELTGDDEDEEFGAIPTPHTTIDLGQPQQAIESRATHEAAATTAEAEADADFESAVEDFLPPANGPDGEEAEDENEAEQTTAPAGESKDQSEGSRPWRGRRRRRGGRRGRGEERSERPEPKVETAPAENQPEAVPEARVEPRPAPVRQEPRQPARPAPQRYTPIMLPGESISKYRNLAQPAVEVAAEKSEVEQDQPEAWAEPSTDFAPLAEAEPDTPPKSEAEVQLSEAEAADEEHHQAAAEVDHLYGHAPDASRIFDAPRRRAKVSAEATAAQTAVGHEAEPARTEAAFFKAQEAFHAEAESHAPPAVATTETAETVEPPPEASEVASGPWGHAYQAEVPADADTQTESDVQSANTFLHETENFPQAAAPSTAPAGRTLEHEVLEDDEMEFHPVPENLEALSEVAGDEELVLEEQTIDRDEDVSDRWVPKIADVDEDEVIAAEERGEKIYGADEEVEEEDEDEAAEPEANGRAEVRAATPTAGYQQRHAERPARPGYDRGNQRGRRGGRRNNVRTRPHSNQQQPLITDLLKEGQEVLIQIAKEPIGKKGARITSHIALPGRFLVYMPTVNHVGVSRKIASEEERQRLKRIVTSERENGLGGFIVRTAAANIKEDELRSDIRFLKHLWAEIKSRAESGKAPALIYHDLNLVERVLRDQVNADFSQIWVDTEDQYERVVRFASRFQPSLVKRIKLYTKDAPLYEHFGIQEEIDRSLKSKVWLKSGGYLVINQTEALVAIDINTGKYVGKTQRLEDTIVKTNVDAVREIVRQVRLRDLGGIIVIDFIDMDERKNRQKVMQALEEALRSDRAPSKVLQFNDFGLVAITRKRVKQSLERTLGEPCPYCTGAGFVKSVTTVCNELYIEMRKMTKQHDRTDITLRVNPEVAKALKANNGKLLSEMEELTGKTVLVKSDPLLHQESFDIH